MSIFTLMGSVLVDSSEANKSISKTEKNAESLGSKLGKGIKTAAVWGAGLVAAAGAAAAGITALVSKTSEYADEVDKLSERTGIGVEELQKWKYAASQSGADISVLETGIKKLSGTMDDAINGNKTATDSFKKLGISVDDLKNKSQEQIFDDIMASLADMEAGAERNALGNDLLGKSYTELLPLLNAGSEGMDELKERAAELGLVMSEDAVDAGVKLGDTWADVKSTFGALLMQIGGRFMPVLQTMLDWVMEHMPEIQSGFQIAFDVIGVIIDTGVGWIKNIIEWAKTWSKENSEQLDGIREKFSTLFEAIGSFLSSFIEWAQEMWAEYGDEITSIMKKAWDLISNIFNTAITLITDIFNVFAALFSGDWEALWESLKTLFTNLISGIYETFKSYLEMIWEYLELAGTFLSDIWSNIWDGIVDIVKNNVNIIISTINGMIDKAASAVNKVTKLLSKIPGVDIKEVDAPQIPKFADGGNFIGKGKFISGEEGAELVEIGASGATITPLNNSQKTAYNTAEPNNTETIITGNNFYIREEADITKIAKELFLMQNNKLRAQGVY